MTRPFTDAELGSYTYKRAAPQRPRPGASPEVLEHHGRLHARRCPGAGTDEMLCPCGIAVVLVCTSCREPVYVCVHPGTWCEHVDELLAGSR